MVRMSGGVMSIFAAGLLAGAVCASRVDVHGEPNALECGTASAAQLRTTLYFGLGRPKGSVSELEWQVFLRDEVTPRFPAGLTVWEAEGQWQSQGTVGHERTKVLLLVHPDSAAAIDAVRNVIARYRKVFDQESVLWETARVCAAS